MRTTTDLPSAPSRRVCIASSISLSRSCSVSNDADVDAHRLPPHRVRGTKLQADIAGIVDLREVDTPRAGLVGMPSLRIARIHHRGSALAQDLAGVNVAQRPVVHPRLHQIVQGAGRVQRVVGVATHVGVQEADRECRGVHLPKTGNEVLIHIPSRIADAVD